MRTISLRKFLYFCSLVCLNEKKQCRIVVKSAILYHQLLNDLYGFSILNHRTSTHQYINALLLPPPPKSNGWKWTKIIMKAAIYARVSSVGERQSTERQVLDLTQYAERNNLTIAKVFEEHVSGAKKNVERPVLMDCLQYAKDNKVGMLLVSELSRLGRNTFEVLTTVKDLIDSHINVFFQKEQMTLLDQDGKPSLFSPILIATLSTCAEMERENIQYRLNSGRRIYVERGGQLGRKKGSVKTKEQKEEQYRETLAYLRKGYSIKATAKLANTSESTVQRLKKEFEI